MSWKNYILDEFPSGDGFSRISAVLDPEYLLADESLFAELETRGYRIIEFTDKLSLRYLYENEFRYQENKKLAILIRDEQRSLDDLPYDIFTQSRKVEFSLSSIFPNLNFSVLNELDRRYFPELFERRSDIPYSPLGETGTCEFLLENLLGLSTDGINSDNGLLVLLFRLHFDLKLKSGLMLKFVSRQIQQKSQFRDWDIDALLASDSNFYAFLQERWPYFVEQNAMSKSCEPQAMYNAKFRGPAYIAFDASEIKLYIEKLFTAGLLRADESSNGLQHMIDFLSVGQKPNSGICIDAFFDRIESSIPDHDARYNTWLDFARQWAELTSLSVTLQTGGEHFAAIQNKVNTAFGTWLKCHYNSLISLPPQVPVMVHQIVRAAARKFTEGSIRKFALIVIDGLAFNQWMTMRPYLDKKFTLSSDGCFAWIPTLTAVSRQAIFSGKIPAMFPASINTTGKEDFLWCQVWEAIGLTKAEVLYRKSLGDGSPDFVLDEIGPKTKICGFVIDKVDKIMHGMQLGNAGMHNQIKQWRDQQYLEKMITGLLDRGFSITITSDHGNIECTGLGRLQEGVLSESQGERVRVYSDETLINSAVEKYDHAFALNFAGLPKDFFPMSLPYKFAFVANGENVVAHGGPSIEEVVVPLVVITGKRDER